MLDDPDDADRRSRVPMPRVIATIAADPAGRRALVLALGVAITLLSWPIAYGPILTGLDPSWKHALHMVADEGLRLDGALVFPYGPLGFFASPSPPVGWTSVLSLAVTGLTYFVLVLLILRGLARFLPWWAAAVIGLVAARMFLNLPPFEAVQVAVFILAIDLLLGEIRLPTPVLVTGGGLLAAIALLGKLNVGVFVAVIIGVTVVALVRPWWRGALGYLGVATLSILALWLVTGHSLAELPPFIAGSVEIVSGYSQAMGTDREPPRYHWIYLAFAFVAATLVWYAVRATEDLPRARRLQILAVLMILLFAMWKTAFARANPAFMFATAGLAAIPFLWNAGRQVALATLASIWIAYLATGLAATTTPTAYLDVVASVRSAALLGRAALPWRVEPEADRTRQVLRDRYDLPLDVLDALGDHSVHVDPWEAAVAQAYPALRWEPLPVFQSYSAYTTALDELGADRLRGDDRPERILREFTPWTLLGVRPPPGVRTLAHAIDGRFYWFESPAATLERLCRYTELVAGDRWQVLGASQTRCGPPTPAGSIQARAGEPVAVPAPRTAGSFVLVRIHGIDDGLFDRIRTAVWKSPEWYIKVDGRRFRLVPGTADDGLLMAVPASAQGSEPFAFGPRIESITVTAGLDGRASDAPLTFEFLDVPPLP